jgi:hypothetical protein
MILAAKRIYYAGTFAVYDGELPFPVPVLGTDDHVRQGFYRLENQVVFQAMNEFGHAQVTAYSGAYDEKPAYHRVIEVPLSVSSGRVIIEAPEDQSFPPLTLQPGPYRVIAAQTLLVEEGELDEDTAIVDFFFELLPQPLGKSRILRADRGLEPPVQLLETVRAMPLP